MRRRELLCVAAGAVATGPFAARAQQMQRVAVLTPSHSQWQPRTFRDALSELGYREGVNLTIEVVSGERKLERLAGLAKELVAKAPDVIVAVNTPGTRAAIAATGKIPIVAAIVADPVTLGIVGNIARPEANVTGIANMSAEITSKRVALLREAVPSVRRLALFGHPDEQIVVPQVQDVERSAVTLGIEHRTFLMRSLEDLQRNLQSAVEWKADAIVRLAGQGFSLGPDTGRLATQRGLPSMLMDKRDVEAGGLMSYFADHRELWRRVAAYVDRLLKGTTPHNLPFEFPSRFELIVNLKTANSLGFVLPPSFVVQADEVVE